MFRLRTGFGLLGLVLLVPLAILVLRSLDALAREHELRHAAVAGRVFDEAEGALAEFLLAEEARPARQYRGPLAAAPHGRTSPLAAPPDQPFVLTYFEADRSGRIDTPRAVPEASLIDELRRAVALSATSDDETAEASAGGDAQALGDEEAKALASPAEQAPGTTRVVQNVTLAGREVDARQQASDEKKREAREASDRLSSYGALEELGRVAKVTRREQAQKRRKDSDEIAVSPGFGGAVGREVAPSAPRAGPSGERMAQQAARDLAMAEGEADGLADAAADYGVEAAARIPAAAPVRAAREGAAPRPPRSAAPAPSPTATATPTPSSGRAPGQTANADEERSPASDSSEASVDRIRPQPHAQASRPGRRIAIAPSRLSGERVAAGRLLLYRTAILDDGVPVRQGMLVDLPALARWLEERVLGDSELGRSMRLEFPGWVAGAQNVAPPENRFVYDHRFDAPFEALTVRLALAPLSDAGSASAIYWMGFLLLLASTAGLYAVYRMAAVAVHFAERRSNFAASVSHELKTPLTAIRMYAEMLRDGMVSDEAKRDEYYATITSESERLSRLIDNVLEWSKLEKHQRDLALVDASVEGPLREVVRVLRPHAEAKGFALVLELESDLPDARHDPDALQQILFNLVDNALKYAALAECKRIEIRAVREGDGVAIRVRDHGPGVDAKHLPLLFDAFYRAEDELTRKTKGTGIGLALVRGLAEAMEGRAGARNAPGGGFESWLWLAVVQSEPGRR